MRHITTILAVVVLCAGTLHADLTPEQEGRARLLVGRFTARDFASRQSAVEDLVAIGPDVVGMVKKTLEETGDNEVKLRCEMVLKGIRETYIVGPDDTLINLAASRHSLDVKAQPVDEVLAGLAKESGNALFIIKGTGLEKRPVTVAFKDLRYWEAVDRVVKAAQLGYAYDYSTYGCYLYSVTPTEEAACYTGPAVVKPYTVTRSITIINGANRRSLSFHFLCLYEERLPVLHGSLVITKATGSDGKPLDVTSPSPRRPLWAVYNTRQAANISQPPALDVKSVDLEGVMRLEYAVGRREVVIADVAPGKATTPAEDFAMEVVSVNEAGKTLRLRLKGQRKAGGPSFTTADARYGLFVRDAAGKMYAPTRATTRYALDGYDQEVIFALDAPPAKWQLVLALPEHTQVRDYPVRLANVPLP